MSSDQTITDIEPLTRLDVKSRRKMSIAIGLILAFLVVAFYVVTLVRLQDNVAKRAVLDAAASSSTGQNSAPFIIKQGK